MQRTLLPLFFHSLFFFGFVYSSFSQPERTFRVRAGDGIIYFYKKGKTEDSILNKNNNVFYLLCKEQQKKNLLFQIENARLVATDNDSLIQVEHLPGLKYESWYIDSQDSVGTDGKAKPGKKYLSSFLNGTSSEEKNKVRIQIFLRKENERILENAFYFEN